MALELKTADDITEIRDADLIDGGDPDTVYQVRHITIEKNRDIVRQNTTKMPNRRTHQRDDVVNWEAVTDDLLDYALVGWRGVVVRGDPAVCSRETKSLLDGVRKSALLERAGMNEIARAPERREESFRTAPDVR